MEDFTDVLILLPLDIGTEADALLVQALLDDLFQAVKGATADEQDILGIHLDELLVGVLASTLRGDVGHRALENLQQRLLHALARDVAGDGLSLIHI